MSAYFDQDWAAKYSGPWVLGIINIIFVYKKRPLVSGNCKVSIPETQLDPIGHDNQYKG